MRLCIDWTIQFNFKFFSTSFGRLRKTSGAYKSSFLSSHILYQTMKFFYPFYVHRFTIVFTVNNYSHSVLTNILLY
ncbi:hypothetical protein EDC23_2544 [Thiohalophilus thiocyanatoxydans]|uniref:Uncharacterized protein n=1 Tax=Thiohalophilus thiocyanatoxydans TaxID=381308 RepID=A0A4R8IFM7_9GAMM|nr:hypothetical protein EDC23_2544 [Thiohalophilus thiocyanatoxydans]